MNQQNATWNDLNVRIVSGLAIAVAGFGLIWIGGWSFSLLVFVMAGLVGWELARMAKARAPEVLGAVAAIAFGVATVLPVWGALAAMLCVSALVTFSVSNDRALYGVFHAFVLLAMYAFHALRAAPGLEALLWLVLVVVVTDIAGYLAGRAIGGPKFWPAISPKKTWSGTVAGWAGAAVVGLGFAGENGALLSVIVLSVALSFASQMGDIAESWIKRRSGVKDSSALIPGHGGVWDRFDGMMGAAVVMWAATVLFGG